MISKGNQVMKNYSEFRSWLGVVLSLSWLAASAVNLAAANAPKTFATPEGAVKALLQAVNTADHTALAALFGPAAQELLNPDEVQGAAELARFATACNTTNRLVRESEERMVLEVGPDAWPFPIPLVKAAQGWQFDPYEGVEELLNRRIGRNELDVLRVMRAYVQAQREYAGRDRDGDGVLEYTWRIASSPGQTDGLYWPPEVNGEISPLGPLVAYAQNEGYSRKTLTDNDGPQSFHGYYFKALTRQGKKAPGGKYDYVINGNMIGGFALVAWPAEYGDSGVMTFIVSHHGRIYQRDLGAATAKLVRKMSAYEPSSGWHLSAD